MKAAEAVPSWARATVSAELCDDKPQIQPGGVSQVQGPPSQSSRRQGYNIDPRSTWKMGPKTGLETGTPTA